MCRNEVLELTDLKSSLEKLISVSYEIEQLKSKIYSHKITLSTKQKFLVSFATFCLLSVLIAPFQRYDTIFSVLSVIVLSVSIYIGCYEAEQFLKRKQKTKSKGLNELYRNRLSNFEKLLKKTYKTKIIPIRYIQINYLEFLLECFDYKRASTIGEALNLLDKEIRHKEIVDAANRITELSQKIEAGIDSLSLSTNNKMNGKVSTNSEVFNLVQLIGLIASIKTLVV